MRPISKSRRKRSSPPEGDRTVPDALAHYSFSPWFRRGLAAEITVADDLGEHPDAGPANRASLTIDLSIVYVPKAGGAEVAGGTVPKTVQVVGPGDVAGLKREAIVRTEPVNGVLQFTAGELAYVEFYEEDLPWRYTPAAASGADARRFKLRPWIALWVLEENEVASFTQGQPPLPEWLTLADGAADKVLPPFTETWAWAHVQVSREVAQAASVPTAIADAPDHALSRLVCPRRLRPNVSYHAVIVPAFETGRLAGLGEPIAAVPTQKPAWGSAGAPRPHDFPVYFCWTFRTGTSGDFETLVRALVARPATEGFGRRALDISQLGFGLDTVPKPTTVDLEGALQAPDQARDAFPATPGADLTGALARVLDLTGELQDPAATPRPHPFRGASTSPAGFAANVPDDPIVVPPVYGRWHAGVDRIADAESDADLAWLRELNLDPRNRAAAGLGAQAIQTRQEELMERAWQQVGDLAEANGRLRKAELAVAAGQAVFEKHLAPTDADRALTLSEALQRGVRRPSETRTMYREMKESRVPLAAQAPAFRRISRPQKRTIRHIAGDATTAALHRDLFNRLNKPAETALSAAAPLPDPLASLPLTTVASAASAAVGALETKEASEPKQIFLRLLTAALRSRAIEGQPLVLPAPAILTGEITAAIPAATAAGARTRVVALAGAILAVTADGPRNARVTIRQALFEQEMGDAIAGKSHAGVTVVPEVAPPPAPDGTAAPIARAVGIESARQFVTDLASANAELLTGRPLPPPLPALTDPNGMAGDLKEAVQPRTALHARVLRSLRGFRARPATSRRPLAPVMAYPKFPDPTFDDLRRLGQDFVIPNFGDIPQDTLMLLEPNNRFIQAFLAGLNHEFARELLWREFPTDQRGSYFRRFWDVRDATDAQPPDVKPLDKWRGALGAQTARPGGYLVLVIRGELLRKYPSTVVYAHRARFGADQSQPRQLADETPGNMRYPVLQAELEPDIALYGFALTAAEARGRRPGDPDTGPIDAGWFFVLKERPGQVRFGMDDPPSDAALPPLDSWNDLTWRHLTFANGSVNIAIAGNALALTGNGGATAPTSATWGQSSADMAYVLFQDPIFYARHAAELLPPPPGVTP
jgi:hypothetical protein